MMTNRRCRDVHRMLPSSRSLIVYSTTFLIAVPVLCAVLQLNHSPYYQCYVWFVHRITAGGGLATIERDLFAQLMGENDRRVVAARKYLNNAMTQRNGADKQTYFGANYFYKKDNLKNTLQSPEVVVMVTVISSRRETYVPGNSEHDGFRFAPNYLAQNVAMLLQLMDDRRQHPQLSTGVDYRLSVCSVGDQLTPEEDYLARLVPVFRNANTSIDLINRFGSWHDRLAWRFEKEKRDYSYCIRETLRRVVTRSRDQDVSRARLYLLIVEDDALPKKDALRVIERLIGGFWTSRTDSSLTGVPLTYAKLYHPKRLHGYVSLEVERLSQFLSMSLFLGTFLYHITLHCSTRFAYAGSGSPSWSSCCIYAGLLVFAVGRVHFDRWRELLAPYAHYSVPDNLCCTQALLYSVRTASQVLEYLDRVTCNETFHKDDALWSFGISTGEGAAGTGLLIQPNLFEHVGFYSGLRDQFLDPHIFISD